MRGKTGKSLCIIKEISYNKSYFCTVQNKLLMSQIKHYDINTPEEFIDAWEKLSPQIFAKAKEINIVLENEDGTPMDSFNLFLTGETTAAKLNQVGVDKKTAERTLQLATEIQNLII